MSEEMPRNMIKTTDAPQRDDAAKEAEWLAANVPSERLELHWRYESGAIQLYERRLRSLSAYGVGPALRSYLRTRLEWFSDNKLYAQPRGIIKVIVETNGDVDVQLGEPAQAPSLSEADFCFEEGKLVGVSMPGTLFVRTGEQLSVIAQQPLRDACETFAYDLAVTLAKPMGYQLVEGGVPRTDLDGADIVFVNEEIGHAAVQGYEGDFTQKIDVCFERLWSKGK